MDHAISDERRWIMIPGMAADERLFEPQRRAFPNLIVPKWIEPQGLEPLASYARRLVESIDSNVPASIGGVSFGGMIALEIAAYLHVESCYLISSVRSPSEYPFRFRAIRPLARFGPDRLGDLAVFLSRRIAYGRKRAEARRLGRLAGPRGAFLRWACWSALAWEPSPETRSVQTYQIHGSRDRTFPVHKSRDIEVVEGGGHLLTLTHPERVNEFLRRK